MSFELCICCVAALPNLISLKFVVHHLSLNIALYVLLNGDMDQPLVLEFPGQLVECISNSVVTNRSTHRQNIVLSEEGMTRDTLSSVYEPEQGLFLLFF